MENSGDSIFNHNTSITQATGCVKNLITYVMWITLWITRGKSQGVKGGGEGVFHRFGGVFHRLSTGGVDRATA